MAVAKISTNSGEIPLEELFSRGAVYQIPLFQRPYKWKKKAVEGLYKDFLDLAEEESEVHFLGATILHDLPNDPARAAVFQVIDGQQRLTTSFLFITAVIKILLLRDNVSSAASLFSKYVKCNGKNDVADATLHPARQDQDGMHLVLDDLLTAELKLELQGQQFKNFPLPSDEAAARRSTVYKNYRDIVRLLLALFDAQGEKFFTAFYSRMLQRTTLVTIVIADMASGPVIYDRLNSGQEPMTIGDLVKNEIFNKIEGADLKAAEALDESRWRPFYSKFQHNDTNYFDAYFFPFGLVWNPNLKKSEVYESLRKRWQNWTAEAVIDDLESYLPDFLDLIVGGNHSKQPEMIQDQIAKLRDAGLPASTYPFLMQISKQTRLPEPLVTPESCLSILKLIEDFLVRRSIIGIEPTGLHAVFKRLWQDIGDDRTVESVRAAINDHVTVTVPTNEQVLVSLQTQKFYQKGIAGYVLKQYDKSLGGDRHDSAFWIEHVYPQNPEEGEWTEFEGHEVLLHQVGNLVLLSEEMNRDISNLPYSEKKSKIHDMSIFRSARVLVNDHKKWTPKEVTARSKVIAEWAVDSWKY